jgi:hypothetical protein
MAIGQPFSYNAPAKLTANWFPEGEMPFAMTIACYSNVLGCIIGFLLPSLFIGDFEPDVIYSEDELDLFRSQTY